MPRSRLTEQAKETRDRMSQLAAVAGSFKAWRPQAEVLREVLAVPTIFPSFDREVGCGGHPTARITVVHGPSNNGKSSFCLGLGRSYLEAGHFFGFADAERTTPQPYVRTLMGASADLPSFSALPVGSYEQVRASVRHYCDVIAEARVKGQIPADTTGLIVLDSLRKLVPEKLWDALTKAIVADAADAKPKPERKTKFGQKKVPTGVDGASGRAGQIKAMYNSAWMDELIPLLADTRIALAIIAREDVHEGEGFMAQEIVELKGGQAIKYDASLQVRCLREFVHEEVEKSKPMVGERIVLEIHKTKVAQKDERVPTAFFHVSNGQLSPEGFDRPRDVFELGVKMGIIETSGSYYKFDGANIGQGQRAALINMRVGGAPLVQTIEAAIRAAK